MKCKVSSRQVILGQMSVKKKYELRDIIDNKKQVFY